MFEKIIEKISEYKRIIIHRHTNPDGDALGSQIGLKALLSAAYPEKEIYAVGDGGGRYAFMEGSEMDTVSDSLYADALAIVLDTSAPALISDTRYTTAAATARIDHHIFIDKICEYEVVDTSYESCCGLIAELAIEAKFPLTELAAKSLYLGMVTDSGRFRYSSVNSNTHRLASYLMTTPFDTTDIYRNLYSDDLAMIRLRASFVMRIQLATPKVAYIYTDLALAKELGYDSFTLSRGMVNTMAEIRGVEVWANFTETEAGVLCELRSSTLNINAVAVKHGGGGHIKASGATLRDKAEANEVLSELIELTDGNA